MLAQAESVPAPSRTSSETVAPRVGVSTWMIVLVVVVLLAAAAVVAAISR